MASDRALFDPNDVALAREFRANPYGRHSDALQRVLTIMRSGPYAGHYVLVQESRNGPYRLAQLGQQRGEKVTVLDETFPDRNSAEWSLFLRRWRAMGGAEVD